MKGPEARLRKKIIEAITEKYPTYLVLKMHGSPYMSVGIPDLIICGNGKFAGLEIKIPGNKPTEIQFAMGEEIRKAKGVWCWVDSVEEALQFVSSI